MSEMKEINTLDLLSDLILMSKTFNNLMYKAELTMDDLMMTKNKDLFAKTKWIKLLITN